jgi:hypothetical protein
MPIVKYSADVFGSGDTPEDSEIAWKRNVRRVMHAVRDVKTATDDPTKNWKDIAVAVGTLLKCYEAASDPQQTTPFPPHHDITLLDRLENSYGR